MLLSMSEGINSFVQFLTVFLIFVFVLVITYLTTGYVAGIKKNTTISANMELIETLRISNNKYLQIVKVGNKYVCMAVCKDTITMLVELKEDEITTPYVASKNFDFQKVFEKMKIKKKSEYGDKETNEDIGVKDEGFK